jgi:hypothetical protein
MGYSAPSLMGTLVPKTVRRRHTTRPKPLGGQADYLDNFRDLTSASTRSHGGCVKPCQINSTYRQANQVQPATALAAVWPSEAFIEKINRESGTNRQPFLDSSIRSFVGSVVVDLCPLKR